jgi:leader peptidase (prepilin peptidase) / N-methyltransferase
LLLTFACGAVFLYCAIAIALEDAACRIVPDRSLLVMFATGTTYGLLASGADADSIERTLPDLAFRSAFPALSTLFAAVLYKLLRGRAGLGMGDIKLIAAAGVWLPVMASFYAMMAASIAALIFAIGVAVRRNDAVRLTHSLPFAAFLAPAFWLSWLLDRLPLRS